MRTHIFEDGTRVQLSVRTSWWAWITLSIYHPIDARVTVRKRGRARRRGGWRCLWLCHHEVDTWVDETAFISIDAMGFSTTAGTTTMNLGTRSCEDCATLTFRVHNTGFPVPPIAGGGGFQGIGFRAEIRHASESATLSGHWRDGSAFPPDFT